MKPTTRVRAGLALAGAGAIAACLAMVLASSAAAGTTLGASAAERGRYFGAAIAAGVTTSLPAGATVSNAWSANRSASSGTIQWTNVDYNGRVAAGQSTEFGFQSSGTGAGLAPACTAS